VTALELRPLSIGEILDGSLIVFRRQFRLLFCVAIVCQGLPAALEAYVEIAGASGGRAALAPVIRLLDFLGSLLVSGATVRVVSEAYLGRVPRLGDALRFATDNMGRVFGTGFVVGFVTILATVALVIPGIVVWCGYSVAVQAAVLETLRATEAMSRSWALTREFKWKALGLWSVTLCLVIAAFAGLGFVLGLAVEAVPALEIPSQVIFAVLSLLPYPLIGCVFTLFYYDLRVRKEGFDLEMLSRALTA
jgi:hypothetical protein